MMDLAGIELKQPPQIQLPAGDFCAIGEPFLWSKQDTDQSIEQAKEWNAVGKHLCHWQGHALPATSPNLDSAPIIPSPKPIS